MDSPPSKAPLGHIPALDGIRGVAVLAILLHHFMQGWTPPFTRVGWLVARASYMAWMSVDLFFALSGFLITGILLDSVPDLRALKPFYLRRVLRIWPLYLFGLLVMLVIAPRVDPSVGVLDGGRHLAYWLHGANLDMAQNGWPPRILAHFWTLSVEEHYYLVWPFVVVLARRRVLRIALAVFAVGTLLRLLALHAGMDGVALFVLTPFRLDSLAIGSALAVLSRRPGGLGAARGTLRTGWLVALAALVATQLALPQSNLLYAVQFPALAVFYSSSIGLVIDSGPESRLSRFFSTSWLTWIGERSYGMYVFHLLLDDVSGRVLVVGARPGYETLGAVLSVAVRTAMTIGVGAMVHTWVEQPFLRLKRFVPYATAEKGP